MSAICYITDSKLLELHRLNQNKEMNFWRLSTNNKFTDFGVGDLLFFLSKDKEHMRNKEKGIVGYGRCTSFEHYSTNTMWSKYGSLNGYRSKEEFIEAVAKVSKNREKPKKISSIRLKDVVFFQSPVYLSDCGKEISNRVESYIYLDKEGETAFKVLESARGGEDIWSSLNGNDDLVIEKAQIRNALFSANSMIEISDLKTLKRSREELVKYVLTNRYKIVKNSSFEGYKIEENRLTIVFAPLFLDKAEEYRILIGQAILYREIINKYYPYDLYIDFKTTNHNKELETILNK